MREILFRGKTQEGKWVIGYYVQKQDPLLVGVTYHYILTQEKDSCGCLMSTVSWYKVIPETVGQYTGLTDKNGKKIFEGDILKDVSDVGNEQPYEVYYNADLCAFMLDDQYWITPTRDWLSKNDKNPTTIMLQIVGNIYDNPELLKGGEG